MFLYSSCGLSGVQGDRFFFLVSRIVLCSSCSGAAGSIHIGLPGAEQRLYTSVFPLREVSLVFGCLFFMCWVHGGQAVAK